MCMNIIPLPAGRALKIPVELAPLTDLFLLCLKGSFIASLLSGNNVWKEQSISPVVELNCWDCGVDRVDKWSEVQALGLLKAFG